DAFRFLQILDITGEGERPIRLEADIDILSNPEVSVSIDMSTQSITSRIHAIIADELENVAVQLEKKFASGEVIARREKRVATEQITGVGN
ncbi:unnamed protein product, partial [marine sediment metagenome]